MRNARFSSILEIDRNVSSYDTSSLIQIGVATLVSDLEIVPVAAAAVAVAVAAAAAAVAVVAVNAVAVVAAAAVAVVAAAAIAVAGRRGSKCLASCKI